MVELWNYQSNPSKASAYDNIPIVHLAAVRDMFQHEGIPIRIRFRGPRSQSTRFQRRLYCLKKDAVTFAVYPLYRNQ